MHVDECSLSAAPRLLSGDEFLRVLRMSGLLSERALDEVMPVLQTAALQSGASPEVYIRELTSRKLLTFWQAENLLSDYPQRCVLGHYKLLDEIGRGGMGRVYLAEHTLMQRKVAIKVVTKSDEQESKIHRFLLESRAGAALDHDHLVRVYHLDNEGGIYYLVMEFIDGEDLKHRVERQGPLGFRETAEYVRQAALGLEYMHRQGLIHRDVKPSNLLLDRRGSVKILDLGLVRSTAEVGAALTGECRMLGTTDFIAPEQVRDSHHVDHRADLYGLGGVLYFLLTGSAPFAGAPLFERLHKHLHEQPEGVQVLRPDAPAGLVAICEQLMSKRPQDRPATAGQVAAMLGAWLATAEAAAKSNQVPPAEVLVADADPIGLTEDAPSDMNLLAQTDKHEALTRLCGGLAHRLNNAFQGIAQGVSLVQLDPALSPQATADLAEIHNTIQAATDLTQQLLMVAGRANLAQAPCKLNAIIDEVCSSFAASIPGSIELRREIPADLPLVLGDEAQLRRALTSLLTNAREALPESGGEITVRVQTRNNSDRPEIDLEVRDTGRGIEPTVMARVFDPFYSTHTPERGLGLAVARGIFTLHGGRISIQSQPGWGALVRVALPAIAARVTRPERGANPTCRGTILVADDEDRIRDLTRRLLERVGYEVLTAKDGTEAVEIFRRESARIDLVLLDQWMPGLCGERALAEIRQTAPDVRAILWSGSADQALVQRVCRSGQVGFVQKPYQATVLIGEVNRLLRPAGEAVEAR